jgi:hypothetical protein
MTELTLFIGLTLGLTWLVCWGPLALFRVPAAGLSTDTRGPPWAIVLGLAAVDSHPTVI